MYERMTTAHPSSMMDRINIELSNDEKIIALLKEIRDLLKSVTHGGTIQTTQVNKN